MSARRPESGSVVVITLVMLVVIGLAALYAMRAAISDEKAVNNLRLDALAQQYAEVGLRYCEAQLALPPAQRAAPLQGLENASAVAQTALIWSSPGTWAPTPSTQVVVLPDAAMAAANSSFQPPRAPECLVEKLSLSNGSAYLVTARGFSPGYISDATSGRTTAGAVVWLQSTLAVN